MAPRNLYEGCISVSHPIAVLDRRSMQTTSTIQTSGSFLQLDPVDLTSYDLLPAGKDLKENIIVPGG